AAGSGSLRTVESNGAMRNDRRCRVCRKLGAVALKFSCCWRTQKTHHYMSALSRRFYTSGARSVQVANNAEAWLSTAAQAGEAAPRSVPTTHRSAVNRIGDTEQCLTGAIATD